MIQDAEFHNLVQGDLVIPKYCRRLKAITDKLADLGEPVRDPTLVLNVLRGLNDRFSHLSDLIQRQRPFSLYPDVLADLQLAEMTMKTKPSAQVFTASAPRPTSSAPQAPPANTHGGGRGDDSGNGGG